MKRIIKLFVNLMAVLMLVTACFSFAGCGKEDIVKVELKLSIYNYAEETWYEESETTLTVKLYRHLAPVTVTKMIEYINEGYYNDTIFYTIDGNTDKIMIGDLKMDEAGRIYQNDIKPTIENEFENGTTKGSDLLVENGSIALWRTWYARDEYSTTPVEDTGRATWFMPTKKLSGYTGNFCVFAKIDVLDETNANTLQHLKDALLSKDYLEDYTVYYTGEYDAQLKDANHGLTFNCEKDVNLENVDKLFKADDYEYVCYNSCTINVAKAGAGQNYGAKIVSAKII